MNNSLNYTANIFKALGDTTRLKIIKLIEMMGNNICVGMIAQKLDISQPAVSQHLKILKNAYLVESERIGFHIHYKIKNTTLNEYGINIMDLLKTISKEFKINKNCELKGEIGKCDNLNK